MRRDTIDAIRERQRKREALNDPRTMAERLADLAAAAPPESPLAPVSSLPPDRTVPLVTITLNELHDLTYNAASTYLHSLKQIGRDKARQHAARIAAQAETIALGSDYLHHGTDPRG